MFLLLKQTSAPVPVSKFLFMGFQDSIIICLSYGPISSLSQGDSLFSLALDQLLLASYSCSIFLYFSSHSPKDATLSIIYYFLLLFFLNDKMVSRSLINCSACSTAMSCIVSEHLTKMTNIAIFLYRAYH